MALRRGFVLVVGDAGACLMPFPGCRLPPLRVAADAPATPILDILRRWPRMPVTLMADGSDVLLCRQDIPLLPRAERTAAIQGRLRLMFPHAALTGAFPVGPMRADGQSWLLTGLTAGGMAQTWLNLLRQHGVNVAALAVTPIEWARIGARLAKNSGDVLVAARSSVGGGMRVVLARAGAALASRILPVPEDPGAALLEPVHALAEESARGGGPAPTILALLPGQTPVAQAAQRLRLPCRLFPDEVFADSLLTPWVLSQGVLLNLCPKIQSAGWRGVWARRAALWGVILGIILVAVLMSEKDHQNRPALLPEVKEVPGVPAPEQVSIRGIIKWPDGRDWRWPLDQDAQDDHE